MTVRSPLKWVGGKAASAERIVAAFPAPHTYDTYVEPCGGAAHVLAAKPPYHQHKEVYNDLDNNLVTFWLVMQSQGKQLAERLQGLPYARSLYYEWYRSLFDGTQLEPFERAVRWFYCLRSTGTGWLRKSPVGWNHTAIGIKSYRNVFDCFAAIRERFQHVRFDNRDILATIKRYDSPRTLFYIDPPYFGSELYYETSKKVSHIKRLLNFYKKFRDILHCLTILIQTLMPGILLIHGDASRGSKQNNQRFIRQIPCHLQLNCCSSTILRKKQAYGILIHYHLLTMGI